MKSPDGQKKKSEAGSASAAETKFPFSAGGGRRGEGVSSLKRGPRPTHKPDFRRGSSQVKEADDSTDIVVYFAVYD